MEELRHPKLVAMSEKFAFKNTSKSRLSLHAAPATGLPMIELNPGEEAVLTGQQFSMAYSHSIRVFRDCTPSRLEMRVVAGRTSKAAKTVSEEVQIGSEEPVSAAPRITETAAAETKSIKARIKTLETEYKAEGTSSDRKQAIKEDIREAKKSLKTLK